MLWRSVRPNLLALSNLAYALASYASHAADATTAAAWAILWRAHACYRGCSVRRGCNPLAFATARAVAAERYGRTYLCSTCGSHLSAYLAVEVLFPLVVWSDSKSAIAMSYDPVSFKKTKHILRAAEFLRDLVAREVIRLDHVAGTIMVADLLTKAVARALFLTLLELLRHFARTGQVVPSTGDAATEAASGGAITGPPAGARTREKGSVG
jgi:hypothetical protein